MKIALYNKYRPQVFADLFGQDHVATTLKNAVKGKSFSHAYLFTGPRGTGKTTAARILAKAINCEKNADTLKVQAKKHLQGVSGTGEPCDKCDSCKNITDGREIDIIEIDAASNRGIDDVRELREKIKFTPTKLSYKIFIIDEVHMLTKEAFNALLKTLEEPPAHAVFVLATTEIHKVPQTIISRCQRFDFKRISVKDIISRLKFIAKEEKIGIEDEALNLIAEASEGGFRDAISYLDQISSYKEGKIAMDDVVSILGMTDYKTLLTFVTNISENKSKEAVILLNELAEGGYDMEQFTKNLIEFLRKLLLIKAIGTEEVELAKEHVQKMEDLVSDLDVDRISQFIETISELSKLFQNSSLPQMALELAVIRLTGEPDNRISSGDDKQITSRTEDNGESDYRTIGIEGDKEAERKVVIPAEATSDVAEAGIQTKKIEQLDPRGSLPRTSMRGEDDKEKNMERQDKQAKMASEEEPVSIISGSSKSVPISGASDALWHEALLEIKLKNPSLHALIKISEPIVEEGDMILCFPYRFHKEKVEEAKNKVMIEEILKMIYNKPYKLKCILKTAKTVEKEKVEVTENKFLKDAIEILGGEVIE